MVHTYTKKLFTAYLKFISNWESCADLLNPTSQMDVGTFGPVGIVTISFLFQPNKEFGLFVGLAIRGKKTLSLLLRAGFV